MVAGLRPAGQSASRRGGAVGQVRTHLAEVQALLNVPAAGPALDGLVGDIGGVSPLASVPRLAPGSEFGESSGVPAILEIDVRDDSNAFGGVGKIVKRHLF